MHQVYTVNWHFQEHPEDTLVYCCRFIMQLDIIINFVHFWSLFSGVLCLFDIISASENGNLSPGKYIHSTAMGIFTQNCGLCMYRGCLERFLYDRLQRKMLVNDPCMPWCMSESLTRGGGENVPGIPGACATRNLTYLARGLWGSKNIWGFLLLFALFLLMRCIHVNLFPCCPHAEGRELAR